MQSPSVLHYVVSLTRVGCVFVLMSRDGVVDVVLDARGATPSDLFPLLRSRFPNTRLVPDDGTHGSWAAAVVERINGTYAEVGVPVDLAWSAPLACPTAADPLEYVQAS